MTVIWPTEGDCHVDDESGSAHAGKGSVITESRWSQLWTDVVPTSRGSWIPTPFKSSQTFPTGGTTLTVDRGMAIVDGFVVDFSGQSADLSFTIPADCHCYVYLTLTRSDDLVDGYAWHLDTTAQVRTSGICIGQAISDETEIKKWLPVSYDEGWRAASGSFDSDESPKQKPVVLGYRPVRVETSGTNPATIEDYGFSIDDLGRDGTYVAALFDEPD